MPPSLQRRYAIERYVSTVDRFLAPTDAMCTGTTNTELVPRHKSTKRRRGQVILGDTHGTEVGLLESKWGATARQILALHSDSLADGYPTYAAHYTDESDHEGQLYVRSTNGPINYVLGAEYGTTHYTPDGAGTGNFHVLPLRSFNATDKLTRLNSATLRKLIGAGARRGMIENGNWLFLQGETPVMWNRKWNESTSAGSNKNRVRPWGHPIPLIMPNFPTASFPTPGATDVIKAWAEGKQFFASVMFKFEDGSYSMPIVARDLNANIPAGLGKVTIPAGAGTAPQYYDYIPWRNVPEGPAGTVARILLRTEQSNSADAVAGTIEDGPAVSKFFICGVINDNTTTAYNDPLGNDAGLIDDPELVRFDHEWPRIAQCVAANESRILIGGNLKPNPAAIVLAPSGVNASRDLNLDEDTSSGLGATHRFFVRISGGVLQLKWFDHGGPTVTTQSITLGAGTVLTLQDVCDVINATTTASAAKEWVAQVVPGTNPQQPATDLMATDTEDVGDDAVMNPTDVTAGNIRAFCPAFPAVLYFSDTWAARYTADDQALVFTGASPGHPPSAANNFYVGNRRRPPSSRDGAFVGAAPLLDKFIVCYSGSIYVLRNIRGGTSGLDDDYRLVPINARRGCIAWDSITTGDGWVGYLTREGYVVTDGEREVVISGDVFDSAKASGDWLNEVLQCTTSTASGGDNAHFHAFVENGILWVAYRNSSMDALPHRRMKYDFSVNHLASGLAEVLKEDGTPFGWSAPGTIPTGQTVSVMGSVQKSDGLWLIGANETNGGSTGDGGVERFDYGNDDNGVEITQSIQSPLDTLDSIRLKQSHRFWMLYKKPGAGVTITFYRDKNENEANAVTIPTSGSNPFARLPIELPQRQRANAETFSYVIQDDGSDPDALEVFLGLLDYDETMSEV